MFLSSPIRLARRGVFGRPSQNDGLAHRRIVGLAVIVTIGTGGSVTVNGVSALAIRLGFMPLWQEMPIVYCAGVVG